MEPNSSFRKRFFKQWHIFNRAGKCARDILWEVFHNYHLNDLKEELDSWKELALCNDNSAYEDGRSREDLVDFILQLHQLIEAFYILNERKNSDRRCKQLKRLSRQAREMISAFNTPILLTTNKNQTPKRVIKQFCKSFREPYVQMELLDMLDAVITYQGAKEIYKGNLILFYEVLLLLKNLAYTRYSGKKSRIVSAR